MQSNLEDFLRAAEDHYLQTAEVNGFTQQVDALQDRLTLYEVLRDQELAIFQVVAHQLQKEVLSTPQADQQKGLTLWISMVRYSAMAMLMNQPEMLENQLAWITETLCGDEFSVFNQKMGELLYQCLLSMLNEDQMAMIEPFLKQVNTTLVGRVTKEFAVLG